MRKWLWLFILTLAPASYAQINIPAPSYVKTLPSTCGNSGSWVLISTGSYYVCYAGVPKLVGGGGTVSSGTAGQIAIYAATGATVSGANALPNGTTATTLAPNDNSTKIATTAYVKTPGDINPNTVTANGNITLPPATPGGLNRTVSFGNSFGAVALDLYDTGTGAQWGWGENASEMQFFGTSNSGDHISFNGSLTPGLKPSGTGERMRLMLDTGDLLIGTTSDCGSLLCVNGAIAPTTIGTATNCSSSASPAVCGAAAAGSAALPTNAVSSSIVVNTTAVTANSQIFVTTDDTLGTKLGVTCNSTVATLVGGLTVSARTAGTSFTISNNVAVVTNPLCVSYFIIN